MFQYMQIYAMKTSFIQTLQNNYIITIIWLYMCLSCNYVNIKLYNCKFFECCLCVCFFVVNCGSLYLKMTVVSSEHCKGHPRWALLLVLQNRLLESSWGSLMRWLNKLFRKFGEDSWLKTTVGCWIKHDTVYKLFNHSIFVSSLFVNWLYGNWLNNFFVEWLESCSKRLRRWCKLL